MDYKAIGQRVRQMRKSLKLTQEELAERTGISTSFMGHIECGTRVLSAKTLMRLAVQLKCSSDFLLGIKTAPEDAYALALERLAENVEAELAALRDPEPFHDPIGNEDFT